MEIGKLKPNQYHPPIKGKTGLASQKFKSDQCKIEITGKLLLC